MIYSLRSSFTGGEKVIRIVPDDSGTGRIFGLSLRSWTPTATPLTVSFWRMLNDHRCANFFAQPWNTRGPFEHDFGTEARAIVVRPVCPCELVLSAYTPEPVEFELVVEGDGLRVEEIR